MLISSDRPAPRASNRLATLAQAITSTSVVTIITSAAISHELAASLRRHGRRCRYDHRPIAMDLGVRSLEPRGEGGKRRSSGGAINRPADDVMPSIGKEDPLTS